MVLYDKSILDNDGKPIFRSKDFDKEDEEHLYNVYNRFDYLFSIKINHGGFFTASPGRIYYNGNEAFVDFIDGDKFSIHEFNHYVKKLGYDSRLVMYYHYLQPNKSDLDVGLKPFACDRDVIKMVSYTKQFKLIEIYIEHAISKIGDWEYTGETSMVIEDLTEDNETLPNLPKQVVQFKSKDITDDDHVKDPIETPAQQCDPTEHVVQDNDLFRQDNDPIDPSQNDPIDQIIPDHVPANVDENHNENDEDVQKDNGDDEFFRKHLETSDKVNDVEVDMSRFKELFQRNDEWLRKSVQAGVGDLQIHEEVVGIDFEQYDSGASSESEGGTTRKKKVRRVKRVVHAGETHTCLQTRDIRFANSTFLSQHLSDTLTSNPKISGKALQDQLQREFRLGIDKQVVYRAKKKAMDKLQGDFVGQYANLRNYAEELMARNPGTTVKIESEMPPNPE
uniref:uncharacterized protein LOC122609214 n=1 Tax=Erigeron canadensis TaxID=72917 RepID=UPI001CB918DC|nr:uncharacterized protein LOC122609214 [Erigeron canadensis]